MILHVAANRWALQSGARIIAAGPASSKADAERQALQFLAGQRAQAKRNRTLHGIAIGATLAAVATLTALFLP